MRDERDWRVVEDKKLETSERNGLRTLSTWVGKLMVLRDLQNRNIGGK
jgi:hypothetical protein